jgi:ZIP family zinc transporter
VLEAAGWAALAASTLVIGALAGATLHASPRSIGLVMGFGAGALIASVAFELTEDAFELAGGGPLTVGLTIGALAFFIGDWLIDRAGGANRKRIGADGASNPLALLLGAALDGVPESLLIGLSLVGGGSIETAFLASVAISNFPEGFASAAGQRSEGRTAREIIPQWLVVVVVSGVFGAIGFLLFDDLGPNAVAFTKAFGAGALLVMVMDTMAPEAYRDAGPTTGLVSVAGFAFAFLLGTR